MFKYTTPSIWELREMYHGVYRFSDELRESVRYMYKHPRCKYRVLFANLEREYDTNDMLKHPYLILRHYMEHPQQYGHTLENVLPHMMVGMWKAFLQLHKQLRGEQFRAYLPTTMAMLPLAKERFLPLLLSDVEKGSLIMHGDEMVKERTGLGLREKKVGYSDAALDYYDTLV